MKGKLEILIGASGSGKSTYASNKVQSDFNRYIRVNRDDIRQLLFGYNDITIDNYYKLPNLNKLEKEVTKYEDTLIYEGIESNKTVIIDNTNLNRQKDLESLKYWNVETELTFFDTDESTCVVNDYYRSRKVGRNIIRKQCRQLKSLKDSLEANPIDFTPIQLDNNPNKPPCIVVDIDNTLAHNNSRNPFDWKRVGEDTVDRSLSEILFCMDNDSIDIIIATGRDGICLKDTKNWLRKYNIWYDDIYIRPENNYEPDWIIKQRIAQEILTDRHILAWFDDRLQVSRHLRMLGLDIYNVRHGNF